MQSSPINNQSVLRNTTVIDEQEGVSSSAAAQAQPKKPVPFGYSKESPVEEISDEEQIKATVSHFNQSVAQYATDRW
jgi:hypothetical protein